MTHQTFDDASRANAVYARNEYRAWFRRLTGQDIPRCVECSAKLPSGWACDKCGVIQDEYNWVSQWRLPA